MFGGPNANGWALTGLLVLALVLTAVVGAEREWHGKDAGVRTHALIGVGAALWIIVSKFGFGDVLGAHVTLDPSRVAAQIVTGVGFIGAGVIFVRRDGGDGHRDDVRGLTTAASVWVSAAIGAACGAALVGPALVVTGLYLVANVPMLLLERKLADRTGRSKR